MIKKGSKKINKYLKELKKEIKELKLTKHHFYYTILCLVVLILSIFLFNNYNKCNLYEINVYKDDFEVKNGFLLMTDGNNILQIDNMQYSGDIENVTSVSMELYVKIDKKEKLINSFSSYSDEYFNLKNYLERIQFNINETKNNESVLTKEVRKNIVDNLYLRITINTEDGIEVIKNINLKLDKLYSSNKLFY